MSRGANLKGLPLTPRELEVALIACRGYSDKYIARKLHIATRTLEKHMESIYRKLDISHRDDLIEREREIIHREIGVDRRRREMRTA